MPVRAQHPALPVPPPPLRSRPFPPVMELSPVDVLGSAPLQRVGHTATLLSLPGRPPEALVYGGDCTNNVLDDMTMLKQSTTGAALRHAPRRHARH